MYGTELRRARKAAGMTLAVLSNRLGMSTTYLADVETGKRDPFRPDTTIAAARECGVDAAPLLRMAAEGRGRFELPVDVPECKRRVASMLALRWRDLTEEQVMAIESAIAA